MVLLNISMKTDTKKKMEYFTLLHILSKQWTSFFPVLHISVNIFLFLTFPTFLADCLDIILTHVIFPLHLVGHQPPNRCCSIKV